MKSRDIFILFITIICYVKCNPKQEPSEKLEKSENNNGMRQNNKDNVDMNDINVFGESAEKLKLLQGTWKLIDTEEQNDIQEIEFKNGTLIDRDITSLNKTESISTIKVAEGFTYDGKTNKAEENEYLLIEFAKGKYYMFYYILSLNDKELVIMSGLNGETLHYKK